MALEADLLRRQSEGEADELRQVEHRHVQRPADLARGQRLLQVEVQVAQRTRCDQAVGVRVGRVGQMHAGLSQ